MENYNISLKRSDIILIDFSTEEKIISNITIKKVEKKKVIGTLLDRVLKDEELVEVTTDYRIFEGDKFLGYIDSNDIPRFERFESFIYDNCPAHINKEMPGIVIEPFVRIFTKSFKNPIVISSKDIMSTVRKLTRKSEEDYIYIGSNYGETIILFEH